MIGGTHRPSVGRALSSRNTRTIGAATATSDPTARTRSVPNRRNTPATMPITIGIGMRFMTRRTQPVRPRTSISSPVAKKAPTTSGQAEVAERRSDEDRAGDRPEERQWLPVQPAGHHGEHAVEEEDAEHPRRQLGLRQAALGADRQDHRDRPGGREDQADQPVRRRRAGPGREGRRRGPASGRGGRSISARGAAARSTATLSPRSGRDPATLGQRPPASPRQSTQPWPRRRSINRSPIRSCPVQRKPVRRPAATPQAEGMFRPTVIGQDALDLVQTATERRVRRRRARPTALRRHLADPRTRARCRRPSSSGASPSSPSWTPSSRR